MKDRCLAAAVKANAVARGIEQPDERRDEAVVGHGLGELVVDREKRGLEIRAQAERHPQHGLHLRHRQGRRNAVTGRVGEHDQHVLANDGEVEGIAAGLSGRPRHAVEVVAGDHRHRGRQRAHLHESRRFELAAQLFAFDHRFRHARPLDRDGALRCQYRSKRFVVGVEDAVDLVQDLHGAHEDVLVIDQGQREHAAGAIAGRAVDLGIEAFVGVAIRDVEDAAFTRARTDETGT